MSEIRVGDKMLFLISWPDGELIPVTIIGRQEDEERELWRFKKPSGKSDFTSPKFLLDWPAGESAPDESL